MPLSSASQSFYRVLGRRIADFRGRLPGAPSQAEIAKRTHGEISRSAIANIETGRHRVAVHQLYILASALDRSVEELLPSPEEIAGDSAAPHGVEPGDADAADLIRKLDQRGSESGFDWKGDSP